MKPLAV